MLGRALAAACAGLAVAAGIATARGATALIVAAGAVAASGFVLVFAFHRARAGRLAVPPLHAVVGLLLAAAGLAAVARPDVVFLPTWFAGARRIQAPAGADAVGRVFVERSAFRSDSVVPDAVARALPAYRAATQRLVGDAGGCPLDVVVARRGGPFDAALGARGAYGFLHRPVVGRDVVVVYPGTGWGSLAHHAMQRWVECALPGAPPWIAIGLATLVEKHHVRAGAFDLRVRSDWRVPESALASPPRDLLVELTTARDQGFLRAFFLFLHVRGHLAPLLDRVRAGEDPLGALGAVTSSTPRTLEAQWRRWLHEEAGALPTLAAASPYAGAPDL